MGSDQTRDTAPISERLTALGFAEPFEILEPEELSSPLVFSSPHSGSVYPEAFLNQARLDSFGLRRSEDAYVDSLFSIAKDIGAPMLRAHFPRAYLDVNREPYELDQRMFDAPLPEFVNTRSLRVAAGLGTIPRVVADAREIYARPLRVDEALDRIEALYKPYHAALRQLMERAQEKFGVAFLIDCHSMPSAFARDSATVGGRNKQPIDFVIGDRFGASCCQSLIATIEGRLRHYEYVVQRNRPYAGGFITEHYGKPAKGWHAVQVEVSRNLYMDEATLERNEHFETITSHLSEVVRDLAREILSHQDERRAAAE
jgi:N-formylglutamate amidohydrolase